MERASDWIRKATISFLLLRRELLSGFMRQKDVKKLICLSFRDFIFDPKCLPTPQRSRIRHPRAIFLTPSSPQILKSISSHLPDGTGTFRNCLLKVLVPSDA
jgi:hypothetical protein